MGLRVDWDATRDEIQFIQQAILVSWAAMVVVVNCVAFRGAGYILLTAPIGIVLFGSVRVATLKRYLDDDGES